MAELRGRTAVVTGAAMGIGRAVAGRLAHDGVAVVLVDIDERAGEEAAGAIAASGTAVTFVAADVASEGDCGRVIRTAHERFGPVSILHNNAAYLAAFDPVDGPLEIWDRVLGVNLRGALLGCRSTIPDMLEGGGGAIVNTSSVAAFRGLNGPYSASKAGINALTLALAVRYGSQGIRVNAVCPGRIDTPMQRASRRQSRASAGATGESDSAPDPADAANALGRFGSADEVANVVAFLVSDEASYITGAILPVDGGFLAS